VPVSIGVEVIDASGYVSSSLGDLPLPDRCDQRSVNRSKGRVVYLDPLLPPAAPTSRGVVADRGWPPIYSPDPLDGAIVWRDRSNNEDGFHIYARRSWFLLDCTLAHTTWRLITTVPGGTARYRPRHNQVSRSIPLPDPLPPAPGHIDRWEYAVSAYNEAGDSRLRRVGGFVGGSEAFCSTGLVPAD
jgi:hypothetical protein